MYEFTCLDFLLLLSGCKVIRGNIAIKILDMVMLLLIVSCYGGTLFASIENYDSKGSNLLLSMIERYSNEVCGLVFIFIIRRHRNDLGHLLKSISESLEPRQKIVLRRYSITCTAVTIMTMIQDAIMTRFHLTSNSSGDIDLQHEIMDWLRSYHNVNSWLMGGCLIFAFFVKVIKFNEVNYFARLEQAPDSMTPEKSSSLILDRKGVILIRRRLLKCFSIIPCLWFLHVFIRGPIIVMELNSPSINWLEKVWIVMPLVYEVIAIGVMTYECDSCTEFTRKKVREVLTFLIREDRIDSMGTFVGELQATPDEEFTAWKTITINRQFFFAFVCSLTSFTILVVQTTKEIFGNVPVARRTLQHSTLTVPLELIPIPMPDRNIVSGAGNTTVDFGQ